jgi:D-alanyl-D-alanine dipeptidase
MTTKAEGIRMRFAPGTSGGVQPITLESFQKEGIVVEELEASSLADRASPVPPEESTPVSSSNVDSANSLDQCKPVAGELKESIETSTIVKNVSGQYVKGKVSFISKLEKAYKNLKSQGIILEIGDGYRSFSTQKAARENYEKNLALYKQGKPWTKGGKPFPASKKPDNIARPCEGYHVRGQAIDLSQDNIAQKKDIQSHGKRYKALYDAGLRRIGNEWWHWSLGEASHDINKKFTDHGGDSATFTKY